VHHPFCVGNSYTFSVVDCWMFFLKPSYPGRLPVVVRLCPPGSIFESRSMRELFAFRWHFCMVSFFGHEVCEGRERTYHFIMAT
jgi:hypothetical protein